MKRIFALLLAAIMILSLVACGGDPSSPTDSTSSPSDSTPIESNPIESEVETPTPDPIDRSTYNFPSKYTKAKIYSGTYGFGDAEIVTAVNDDESAFYMVFTCFDEDQIVEGTVSNGICLVTFDKTGFMSMDAQQIFDDALASSEPWHPLIGEAAPAVDPIDRAEYGIPEQYTKAKIYSGTYGFGDAEIVAAVNDDESEFYLYFVCFDEEQIVEGTVSNGICLVTFDKTGFMAMDAQLIFDDALANENPWAPLIGTPGESIPDDPVDTQPEDSGSADVSDMKKIVCLGDSITAGGYPSHLQSLIDAEYSGYLICNYGKPGAITLPNDRFTYVDMEAYSEAVALGADMCIIMFGTNDTQERLDFTVETFRECYKNLLDGYISANPNCKVYIVLPPTLFRKEDGTMAFLMQPELLVDQVIPIIKELATERNLTVIDMYAYTNAHPEWTADGVHPNEIGAVEQAKYIWECIRSDFK